MPNKILVVCTLKSYDSESAVLYLLLPLRCLLPGVGTQAVHPLAGHQVEETSLVSLLGGSRWNSHSRRDSFHLQRRGFFVRNIFVPRLKISPRSGRWCPCSGSPPCCRSTSAGAWWCPGQTTWVSMTWGAPLSCRDIPGRWCSPAPHWLQGRRRDSPGELRSGGRGRTGPVARWLAPSWRTCTWCRSSAQSLGTSRDSSARSPEKIMIMLIM